MKRPSRRVVLVLAGIGCAVLAYALTRPPVRYTIQGVVMDEGSASRAISLNNRGDILVDVDMDQATHRILLERGGQRTLINLPGTDTEPLDLNNRGDVLCRRRPRVKPALVLWRNGRAIEPKAHRLSLTSGRLAPDGTVVGSTLARGLTTSLNNERRAVLWQEGNVVDLSAKSVSPTEDAMALAMNAAGVVVGFAAPSQAIPVIWRDGKTQRLAILPGCTSAIPVDVNDRGLIVGTCETMTFRPFSYSYRAALWENGTVRGLGTLEGDSAAFDINLQGQAVGYSVLKGRAHFDWRVWRTPKRLMTFDRDLRATLFENGKALNLNHLIPARSGWTLEEATAINDKGQIVGAGRYRGQERGFVLTPTG